MSEKNIKMVQKMFFHQNPVNILFCDSIVLIIKEIINTCCTKRPISSKKKYASVKEAERVPQIVLPLYLSIVNELTSFIKEHRLRLISYN